MVNFEEQCHVLITTYSKQPYNILTERGNSAIHAALFLVKQLGCTSILVPDQGGWLTFASLSKELGLDVQTVSTDKGLLSEKSFSSVGVDRKSALLFTTLAGYFARQDTDLIERCCKQKNIFIIEDCSGVLNGDFFPIGNILVASFGRHKLINNFHGGFVGFQEHEYLDILKEHHIMEKISPHNMDYQKLNTSLKKADQRYAFLVNKCNEIKNDLASYAVVHRDKEGIVVVVEENEEQKIEQLKKYCAEKKLEFTLCPREIRMNHQGISIEVKRLE